MEKKYLNALEHSKEQMGKYIINVRTQQSSVGKKGHVRSDKFKIKMGVHSHCLERLEFPTVNEVSLQMIRKKSQIRYHLRQLI